MLAQDCRETLSGYTAEDVITGVADDARGSAYLGCSSGAALRLRLSPLRLEARLMLSSVPLISAVFRPVEGDLWFGTADGQLKQLSTRARNFFGLASDGGSLPFHQAVHPMSPHLTRLPSSLLSPPQPPPSLPRREPPLPRLFSIISGAATPFVHHQPVSLTSGSVGAATHTTATPKLHPVWLSKRVTSEITAMLVCAIRVLYI